jgi:ParB-like chromosome segregation protein Spo0J
LLASGSPRIGGENTEHLRMLAEVSTELPPILVHHSTMHVIDGVHRLGAAKLRGEDEIAVQFFYGDRADAFVLAVKSNIAHGLPLSLADRKSAAARIVASYPEWSDRVIASVSGLSAKTVSEIRIGSLGESARTGGRVGLDGRTRPVSSAEGRQLASELIADNPEFSLRQIARIAGISPETVRDVRNRLRRGEDPVPDRRTDARARSDRGDRHQGGYSSESRASRPSRGSRAELVQRLRADPALRFSESGRMLLRLLQLQLVEIAEWEKVIDGAPPHCSGIIADLARDCSRLWSDLADALEHRVEDIV